MRLRTVFENIAVLAVGAGVGYQVVESVLGVNGGLWLYVYTILFAVTLSFAFRAAAGWVSMTFTGRGEMESARVIIENLKERGVLEINLSDLRSLWAGGREAEAEKEEKEINIDMSRMYHFWRDETAIEIHKQEERGFSSDRIRKFFTVLKGRLKTEERLGNPNTGSDLEKSVFQAEYRIILFLLGQIDEKGHCPSVVDVSGGSFKSEEPDDVKAKQNVMEILPVEIKSRLKGMKGKEGAVGDGKKQFGLPFKSTYEVLRNVNLANHSINVAENIIELIEEDEDDEVYRNTMLPVAVIAALAHDLGKIPEYYTDVYNKLTHPLVSARILQEFIEGYSQALKRTLDKQIVEIMVEAVKNHHATVTPAAAVEPRFKKIINYLKKADTKARMQEVESVLAEYGFLKDRGYNAERSSVIGQSTGVEKDDLEEAERSVEEINRNKGVSVEDEGHLPERTDTGAGGGGDTGRKPLNPAPASSYFTRTANAFRERLKIGNPDTDRPGRDHGADGQETAETGPGSNRIIFRYPDFDRYTGMRPSKEEEKNVAKAFFGNYRDELLKNIPDWTELPEAVQTGLKIIEERINYCRPPLKDGSDPIVGVFTVKGTVFVLSTVMMAIVYYIGEKLYNDRVVAKPYYQRGAYFFAYVNGLKKMGMIDEKNIKVPYFAAPFTIYLTDFEGNHCGTKSGTYTPFNLQAVADYFSKPVDYYEERKKNPAYCPGGYLLKMTGFRWGS